MKKIISLVLAALMALFCLTGCSQKSSDTVMTVNGDEVSWDEYMYWIGYATNQLNQYYSYNGSATDFTDSTTTDIIFKDAKSALTEQHVILAKAAEMGLTVDEEEVSEVINNYISYYCGEDGTEEDFAEVLSESYATVDTFKSMIESNFLYTDIINELYGENGANISEDDIKAYADENDYITATHILLLKTDDEGEELSEKEQAKLKAQAQGFVDELNGIKDDAKRLERFNELKAENCQDTGKESYPDGYCFTTGTMVEEFDTAARELGEYKVSEVVESDYGYHVIMRLPLKGTDLCSSQDGYPMALSALVAQEQFTAQFEQWVKDARVELVGKYKNYDFSSLFTEEGFQYVSFADVSGAKG